MFRDLRIPFVNEVLVKLHEHVSVEAAKLLSTPDKMLDTLTSLRKES